MNQKQRDRKRLKREKIRAVHLEKARRYKLNDIHYNFEKFLDTQFIFHKDVIPHKNDHLGWAKLNTFRTMRGCWDRTIKIFGNVDDLMNFRERKVGYNDSEILSRISWYLTVGAMSLDFEIPFFLPCVFFNGDTPTFEFVYAKRPIGMHSCWNYVCNDKEVHHDGKIIPVYFKEHCLWRLWERATISKDTNLLLRACVFTKLVHSFRLERLDNEKLAIVNGDENMKAIFGLNEPFGYCPYVEDNGAYVCLTYLLPGYKSTPEGNILAGDKRINHIKDIHDVILMKEKFENAGIRSFVNEATDAMNKKYYRPKVGNYDFVNGIWEKAKSFIKEPILPQILHSI